MMDWTKVTNFFDAIHVAMDGRNFPTFFMKANQMKVLEGAADSKDVVGILPTGYGKSLIFQLLPFVMQTKDTRNIVIVVTPLSSIIIDQLQILLNHNIKAAVLRGERQTYNVTEPLFDKVVNEDDDSQCDDIKSGDIDILFSHPEDLLSDEGRELLSSDAYIKNVCACVIDEAHCIEKWGEDFRTDFEQLSTLKAFFPTAPIVCMTATSSKASIDFLIQNLCLASPLIVAASPNRDNIFFKKFTRDGTTKPFVSHYKILEPLARDLLKMKKKFPMTIIYMKLKYCGYAYKLFEEVLGDEQYVEELISSPSTRLFCQYHAPQTTNMKKEILGEVMKSDSNIRIIFATSALGMGVNIPFVERIIHISPPSSLEEYMQHVGRGGRSIDKAEAILYYNNHDISTISHVDDNMRQYCLLQNSCLRKYLVNYFGFKVNSSNNCCSQCFTDCEDTTNEHKEEEIKYREKVENITVFQNELTPLIQKMIILDSWQFGTNTKQLEDLPSSILESVEFITDENYLLEHFGIWSEDVAHEIIECLDKYASRLF